MTKRSTWAGKSRPPVAVALRYALLQVPGTALVLLLLWWLRTWFEWSWWAFWVPLMAWVAKDVALFPFVWRSYGPAERVDPLVGQRGEARERLAPAGYVLVRGELWRAQIVGDGGPIERGEPVVVREVRGLTLLVEPGAEVREGGT